MSASKRRICISDFVGEATKFVVNNDKARADCLKQTGCLLECVKSSCDDLINPRGVPSEINTRFVGQRNRKICSTFY